MRGVFFHIKSRVSPLRGVLPLALVFFFCTVKTVHAQKELLNAEYFWNTDPGAGNGYAMQAADGNFNEVVENILKNNATLPAKGTNTLNIRVMDDANNWGPVFKKVIELTDSAAIAGTMKVTAAEYFWNTDPGAGNGITLLAFDGNFNEALEQIFRNNATLPAAGTNLLAIRVRDGGNNWGPVFKRVVQIADVLDNPRALKISAAEYFWNADPGAGSATALLAFDGNYNEALEQIFTNTAMLPAMGTHLLGIRVRDERNQWGPVFKKVVQVTDVLNNPRALKISAAEYFWNTDPGAGSGAALLAFDGNYNEALEQIFTNTATLPAVGTHLLGIRVRDEKNQWGPVFKKVVQVADVLNNPRAMKISAGEYFWNTDPGAGSGTALLAFDGNYNEALEQVFTNNATLPAGGRNLLGIRVRDEKNQWGPVFKKVVSVSNALNAPRLLAVTQAEYFWDADPGFGAGYPLLAFDGNFNEALEAGVDFNATTTFKGIHLLCARVKDENGKWGPTFKRAVNVVSDYTVLNVTIDNGNTNLCSGDSLFLEAHGAGSYVWSPATGLNNTLGAVVIAKPTTTTTYMVIGEGTPGEYDTAYTTITVVPGITLHLGNDTTICSPNTVTLNAGTASAYAWSTGATTQTISVSTSGTYTATITGASGCSANDSIKVTVNNGFMTSVDTTVCFGETFAGHNASGTYTDTFVTSGGCDSIRTLTLTVRLQNATTVNQSICQGESFAGYNTTGNFVDVFTDRFGCDSTRTLNLTVRPNSATTITDTICDGESLAGYNVTGTYVDTFISANGCDSVRTIHLTVLPDVAVSISQTICFGTSFAGYTTGGTYVDVFTAANGCDSTRTLNLTVRPQNISTVNAGICQGQSLAGYTTSGTYVDTFADRNGCDSIRTLNLTVAAGITQTINQTICYGDAYAGYSASGTYVDTFTASAGCDSIRTLNLTVRAQNSSTVSRTICQGQSFGGYTAAGVYVDTLVDQYGCDSVRTINLTVNANSASSLNRTICAGENFAGYTATGTYADTLVAANGCDSVRTINLTVLPNATLTIDTAICFGETFSGYDVTGTYTDTFVAANGCDSVRTINLVVRAQQAFTITHGICSGQSYAGYTVSGTYIDTFADQYGCDSIRTLHLTVASSIQTTIDTVVCFGGSFAGYSASGTYLDTFTASAGCDSIRTLNLTMRALDVSTVAATICPGQSFAGYNSAGTYLDTFPNQYGCDSIRTLNLAVSSIVITTIDTAICFGETFAGYDTTGQYVDTFASGGCDSVRTLNLTVLPHNTSSLTITICDGETFAGYSTSGTYADTFVAINGCDSVRTLHLTVNAVSSTSLADSICTGTAYSFNNQSLTQSGVYYDTLFNAGACDSVIELTLTLLPLPQPVITQSGDTLSTGSFTSYQWLLNGDSVSNATLQQLVLAQNGDYNVIVTDANGCSDTSALSQVTGVGVKDVAGGFEMKLYPNPNTGTFILEFSDDAEREIVITDLLGRIVQSATKVTRQKLFDLKMATAGVYFLRATQNEQVQIIKVVVADSMEK